MYSLQSMMCVSLTFYRSDQVIMHWIILVMWFVVHLLYCNWDENRPLNFHFMGSWNCSEFRPCTTIVWCLYYMCALCVCTILCVLLCTFSRYIHRVISNSSVLCLNRSSMSYTAKWAPPSSFVRFVLRTTRTSRSNPVVTWCALLALRPGRYCTELCCMKLISGSDLWLQWYVCGFGHAWETEGIAEKVYK